MPLRFPKLPDIPLEHPPLTEVICQVRFPPILKLAEQAPIEFQELMRRRFPGFSEQHGVMLRLESQEGQILPSVAAEMAGRTYGFQSTDEASFATLGVNFYALTTRKYTVWESFSRDLDFLHQAVIATVTPVYATRIGLRYVNALTTANTGKDTLEDMSTMLRPALTALLKTEVWDSPKEMLNTVVIPDNGANMILRVGLQPPDKEPGLLLDIDYFEEGKLPLEDLIERCRRYHDVIYGAFRWCLADDAIQAFGPR